MSNSSTPTGGIREYFLLADARATAKRIPEEARAAIGQKLGLGRQRAEAADALWSNGHTAEGLRLAAEAFEATLEAIPRFAEASGMWAKDAPIRDEHPKEAVLKAEPSDSAADADQNPDPDPDPDTDPDTDTDTDPDTDQDPSSDSDGASPSQEPAPAASPSSPASAPDPRAQPGLGRSWDAILRRRGMPKGRIDDVLSAESTLRSTELPLLDQDVSTSHGELFQQLIQARRHIDRTLAPATMTSRELAWTQASRFGFVALLLIASLVGLFFLLRTPTGIEARASARFGPEFPPEHAVDDDESSEWLLPDRTPGWVEAAISPPTRVERVRLLNSHNRHYNDRATREYTVELFSGDRVVQTIEGRWDELVSRPEWTDHPAGHDGVDRIRFTVRSWFRNGGGLAELRWE